MGLNQIYLLFRSVPHYYILYPCKLLFFFIIVCLTNDTRIFQRILLADFWLVDFLWFIAEIYFSSTRPSCWFIVWLRNGLC
jgi:hypothetical protein